MKREEAIFCGDCAHFITLYAVTSQGDVVKSRYGCCRAQRKKIQDNLESVECPKYKPIEYNHNYSESDIHSFKYLNHITKRLLVSMHRILFERKN